MAQNITLLGASYTAVPAVTLPKTGGGTAKFSDASVTTAVASDVAEGKIFLLADGTQATGTASGGGGGVITETVMDATIAATDQDTSGYVAWLKTQWYDYMSETLVDDTNYIVTIDGTPYLCRANAVYGGGDIYCGDTEIVWGTPANSIYPFAIGSYASGNVQWMIGDNQPHSVKVEKVISMSDSTTLTTKTITTNGTYSAEDDDADGYSSVTVNVPSGGASNLVTGTFTGTTTGTAMDVNLAYTGNGYPIAVVIYPSRSDISTFNSLIQRYVIRDYCADKMNNDDPSYSSSGNANSGYVCLKYKSSASNSTSYSNGGGSGAVNVYNDTSATASSTLPVQIRSKTKMSVFIASTSYGFAANIEYTYRIVYSE